MGARAEARAGVGVIYGEREGSAVRAAAGRGAPYGTATPASDLDAKAVVLPAACDILLQRVQAIVVTSRAREPGEAVRPGEEDVETFGLQRYLALLAGNQPLAIEMLFAPDAFMLAPPDKLWREVQAVGPGLLTGWRPRQRRYEHGVRLRAGLAGKPFPPAAGGSNVRGIPLGASLTSELAGLSLAGSIAGHR